MPIIDIADFLPGPRLDQAIAWASSRPDGAGFNELLRAVAEKRIALTAVMNRRSNWTPRSLKSRLPTIVLIGDDHDDPRDPAEWRCSTSLIAWARCAVVHGTGAQAEHYREAIRGAELLGRCLFIETDSAHAPAWAAAIMPRGIPCLSIIPPNGGVHPAVGAAAVAR
ncbi:MAG TPA: hypothetical protein VMB73_25485 [Acetobacteraceae bacterium]|nr:hypothetical protein [Acetobacteraceae bacterium]